MNPYELAIRYLGIHERPGPAADPFIAAWILDAAGQPGFPIKYRGPNNALLEDETPWCGAFVFHVACRLLGLEAPAEPVRARAWLRVGIPIEPSWLPDEDEAARIPKRGDVVVLSRGPLPQPSPEVQQAPGHVGFLAPPHAFGAQHGSDEILLVSGNMSDAVTLQAFPIARVLGVRRLRPAEEVR